MLNKPWSYIDAGSWYPFWGGPSSIVAERIGDRLLYDSDVVHHSWWGYGQAFSWNPRRFADEELADAQRSWDHMHQLLDEQLSATPGRFRVRVWRATEASSNDSVKSLGTPVVTAELTLLEGQDASWCHVFGTELVADYHSMVAVPVGIRGMSKRVSLRGDQVRVLWEHGQVSATYTHRSQSGPLAQFDTSLREPGPLVLETLPTSQQELHWLAPLGVGEKAVAVSPAGDGHVLVGELHRLE
jgi:hypothetical protein